MWFRHVLSPISTRCIVRRPFTIYDAFRFTNLQPIEPPLDEQKLFTFPDLEIMAAIELAAQRAFSRIEIFLSTIRRSILVYEKLRAILHPRISDRSISEMIDSYDARCGCNGNARRFDRPLIDVTCENVRRGIGVYAQ